MPPKVSIISVYYNTPEELLRLGVTIQNVLPEGLWEWIVVDNNSERDLSAELGFAKYFQMGKNLGFSRACNRGAEVANGSFLFFVNPDCEMIGDCLTPLCAAVESGVVAGPFVYHSDGTVQLSFGPFLSITAEFMQRCMMRFEKTDLLQKWLQKKTATNLQPDYVSGCALMIRADSFRELGGFDEAFFLYHEDVDLCLRARNQGIQTVFVPEARIVHHRNRSRNQEQALADVEYRKSQLHYYAKHRGRVQRFILKTYLSLKFRRNPEMLREIRSHPDYGK